MSAGNPNRPEYPPSYAVREVVATESTERVLEQVRKWSAGEIATDQTPAIASGIELAITQWVNVGVRLFDEPEVIKRYLVGHDVAAMLEKLVEVYAASKPESFWGRSPAIVYAACLLDHRELVPPILAHTTLVDSRAQISRFWQDHRRALVCLAGRTAYRPDLPEKFARRVASVTSQLAVIEAITCNGDVSAAVAAEQQQFARANRDRRIFDVAVTSIYPSGQDPVRFDLGLWAILDIADLG